MAYITEVVKDNQLIYIQYMEVTHKVRNPLVKEYERFTFGSIV